MIEQSEIDRNKEIRPPRFIVNCNFSILSLLIFCPIQFTYSLVSDVISFQLYWFQVDHMCGQMVLSQDNNIEWKLILFIWNKWIVLCISDCLQSISPFSTFVLFTHWIRVFLCMCMRVRCLTRIIRINQCRFYLAELSLLLFNVYLTQSKHIWTFSTHQVCHVQFYSIAHFIVFGPWILAIPHYYLC